MIKALPKEFLDVISQNDNLLRYLDSLSTGRDFTPRSWLYENEEPDAILNNWLDRLHTLENGGTFEQEVYQFDTSQLAKWGPQGGIAPMKDLLKEIVLPTFKKASPLSVVNDALWKSAKEKCYEELHSKYHIRSLRLATYQHVLDDMRARDTLESNSGWPDFKRRNLPEVKKAALLAAADGEWIEYPAIALFRNYNNKTRLVWMFPEATNIHEGSYLQPLQTAIIKNSVPFFCPWIGFEAVRDAVTNAYAQGKFISATDFSKTDEHFSELASMQVVDVISRFYQEGVDKSRLANSIRHMHNIPLIISPQEYIVGQHGVASGSNWTNFDETIFDYILSKYVEYKLPTYKVAGLYAIGDDMAWCSDKFNEDFPSVISSIGQEVGQDINAEKVTNEPDKVKTLQRLFQRGYSRPDGKLRGVYSTIRALKSSVYPERFHKPKLWSSDMFCARQYMILENCVDHPLFEEFVKFVVVGQKDLIPFAKKSSAELNRILRETKLLPGFNPTYNQEKRDTSLANFASIGIARNL